MMHFDELTMGDGWVLTACGEYFEYVDGGISETRCGDLVNDQGQPVWVLCDDCQAKNWPPRPISLTVNLGLQP